MHTHNKIPLGYIELENGAKPIYAMNDIFLNYIFDNEENWEALRLLLNIMLDAYKQIMPSTMLDLVEGEIKVETQYKYLLNVENTTRAQDIKMTATGDITYIEFQNRTQTTPPIEARAVEYFGLGIGHSKGKTANQVWLLADDIDSVLHGEQFARYILKNEATGVQHPGNSGIMYVSLPKLSQKEGPAGELAAFLMGKVAGVKSETANKVAQAFNDGFNMFKRDKEALTMMTVRERWLYEGRDEGREEGIAEGEEKGIIKGAISTAEEFAELLRQGYTPEEILQMIKSRYTEPTTA